MGQRPDELRERTIVVRVPPSEDVERQADAVSHPHAESESESDYDETAATAREDIEQTRAEMTT